MAFCKNCGNQIPSDSAFCPGCGTRVDDAQQSYNQAYQQNDYQQNNNQQNSYQPNGYQQNTYQPNGFQQNNYQQNGYQQNNYQQNGYQQTVQPGVVSGSERGLAWLSYIIGAPTFLIPLFVKKTSEYCRFHVKQGATLWAISTAYGIFYWIFLAIINAIFPGRYSGVYYITYHFSAVYNVFSVILGLVFVALSVFAIIGIVFAATGKQKELPLISKIPWVGMLIDKIYNSINH